MPIYEYHCGKCGADFEKLVPSVSAKVRCDKCGSPEVSKKLSRFAPSVRDSNACPGRFDCPSASHSCGHGGGCCCGGH